MLHRCFAYKHDGFGSISSIVNRCSSGMRRVLIVVVVVAASVMHSFIYRALRLYAHMYYCRKLHVRSCQFAFCCSGYCSFFRCTLAYALILLYYDLVVSQISGSQSGVFAAWVILIIVVACMQSRYA